MNTYVKDKNDVSLSVRITKSDYDFLKQISPLNLNYAIREAIRSYSNKITVSNELTRKGV